MREMKLPENREMVVSETSLCPTAVCTCALFFFMIVYLFVFVWKYERALSPPPPCVCVCGGGVYMRLRFSQRTVLDVFLKHQAPTYSKLSGLKSYGSTSLGLHCAGITYM